MSWLVGKKIRKDPFSRRLLSKIFNTTVSKVSGVDLHDMNCGFKAYRAEVVRSLPVYADLFRFIPVFAKANGFSVTEIPINHEARKYGRSRYGWERITRGMFDLLTVTYLSRFAERPMHLFGVPGVVLTTVGVGSCGFLALKWLSGAAIGGRPLLALGVMCLILGLQFFSIGLLGEFLVFQHKKAEGLDLPIKDTV